MPEIPISPEQSSRDFDRYVENAQLIIALAWREKYLDEAVIIDPTVELTQLLTTADQKARADVTDGAMIISSKIWTLNHEGAQTPVWENYPPGGLFFTLDETSNRLIVRKV